MVAVAYSFSFTDLSLWKCLDLYPRIPQNKPEKQGRPTCS